jgi:hypothetical protein
MMTRLSEETFEGRLIAHRRLLAMIIVELSAEGRGETLLSFLRQRDVLQDGQEDPGAVPTEALDFALAIADEFLQVEEAIDRHRAWEPAA